MRCILLRIPSTVSSSLFSHGCMLLQIVICCLHFTLSSTVFILYCWNQPMFTMLLIIHYGYLGWYYLEDPRLTMQQLLNVHYTLYCFLSLYCCSTYLKSCSSVLTCEPENQDSLIIKAVLLVLRCLHYTCYSSLVKAVPFKPGRLVCTWFLEIAIALIHMLVCVSDCLSVCPPPRLLITSGMIWCDINHVWLVKQVLWLFPLFSSFIWYLPLIKLMGLALVTQHVVNACQED